MKDMHDLSAYPPHIRGILEAEHRLVHCMFAAHSGEWLHLDLTMSQLKGLMALTTIGALHIGQLAELLKVTKPSASLIVDHLVHEGFARRVEDETDRRRTWVSLTPEGVEFTTRLRQGGMDRLVQWLETMSPDDRAALQRGLEALAVIAEHEAPSAPIPSLEEEHS